MITNYKLNFEPRGKVEEFLPEFLSLWVNKFNEESAKSFVETLFRARMHRQTVIPVTIDSYGGTVDSLLAMIDALESTDMKAVTIALGKAMSCGSFLLAFGTPGYRFAAPTSRIMIHDLFTITAGKTQDIAVDAEEMKRLSKHLFERLDEACGKDTGYFDKLIQDNRGADLFLTPQEAKKHGLIDHIGVPEFDFEVKHEMTLKLKGKKLV